MSLVPPVGQTGTFATYSEKSNTQRRYLSSRAWIKTQMAKLRITGVRKKTNILRCIIFFWPWSCINVVTYLVWTIKICPRHNAEETHKEYTLGLYVVCVQLQWLRLHYSLFIQLRLSVCPLSGNLSLDDQSNRTAQCWVCNWSCLASHSGLWASPPPPTISTNANKPVRKAVPTL